MNKPIVYGDCSICGKPIERNMYEATDGERAHESCVARHLYGKSRMPRNRTERREWERQQIKKKSRRG